MSAYRYVICEEWNLRHITLAFKLLLKGQQHDPMVSKL